MKRILLGIVCILLIGHSIETHAQDTSVYKKKWLFGMNWGGAWENADVHSRLGTGWGLTLEKEIIANNSSLFGFSLRGRYLRTWMWGRESSPFYGIANDNNLNGINNPVIDYNTPGYVYRNFYTKTDEFSLEGLLILNRLRAHSGFKIYGFGGIAATGYLSKINQLDDRGNTYNYSSVTSSPKYLTRADLNKLWDNTYETNGVHGQNRTSYVLSGAIGIGIGIKLSPNVYLGWEHKYTYTSTDQLDASKLSKDGTKSVKNDRYHYSNLFLTVALGSGSASTKQRTPEKTYHPTSAPIHNPVITLLYPKENPVFLQDCNATINLSITNIGSLNQLTVLLDGNVLSSEYYRFNAVTTVLEINKGIYGNSVFTIIAQNDSGKDIKYVYINCTSSTNNQPVPTTVIPTISIVRASGANCTAHVEAYVKNVSSISFIEVIKDGITLSSNIYRFNAYNGTLIIDVPFYQFTSITIRAKNNANAAMQTVNLSCNTSTTETDKLIAPQIKIVSAIVKKDASGNCTAVISASVSGVTSVSMLAITRNGVMVNPNNYSWNSKTGVLTLSNAIVGSNVFLFKATNAAGVATADVVSDCSIQNTIPEPIIKLVQPLTSIYTSATCKENVIVKVENIQSLTSIEVKINNIIVPQNEYTYVISSGLVTIPTSFNTSTDVEVIATNESGLAKQTIHLLCNKMPPPYVLITSPTTKSTLLKDCSTLVQARVENVSDINQFIVTTNGILLPNKNYTFKEGKIELNVIVTDKTLLKIRVANASGEAQDTVLLICNATKIQMDSVKTVCEMPVASRTTCSSCDDTIRVTSGLIVVEANRKVCISNTFVGNVTMNGGELIICGNATIQTVNYKRGNIIIIGTAQFNNLNMNNSSSLIRNYGTATISNLSFNGRLENYGQLTIKSDFNINSGAVFVNTGSVNAKMNFNNNNIVCNSGDMTVDGNLKDNGTATFTNGCKLFVRGQLHINKTFVNTGSVKVGSATFVNATGNLRLEASSQWLTTDIVINGSIQSSGASCALVQIKNETRITTTGSITGKVDLCDLNGIEFQEGSISNSVTTNCSCTLPQNGTCIFDESKIVEVVICHKLGPDKAQSLTIPKKDLALHLAHGDHIGNCTSADFSTENSTNPPVINPPVVQPKGEEEIRVTVCHKNVAMGIYETLSISKSTLVEHLAHGDQIGECDSGQNPVKEKENNTTPETANEEMVQICHKSVDSAGVVKSILIPKSKLGLHLSHGDHIGICTSADNNTQGGSGTIPPVTMPPNNPSSQEMVVICHKNADGSVASISVLRSQLNQHFAHGDHVGMCTESDYPVRKIDPVPQAPKPEETIVVCHKNGDGSVATMTIVRSQLNQHLSHGDHVGACTQSDYPVKKIDPVPQAPKSDETIVICHKNGDGSVATMTIVRSQLNQHLSHGDHVGACTQSDYPVKKVDPVPSTPQPEETVVICHQNGNGSVVSITIVKSQLNSHLGHGDHLGACTDADQPVKKVDPVPPTPQPEETVVICHKNGNGSVTSITIVKSQLSMHLGHGDHLGACTDADQPVKKVDPVPPTPQPEETVVICHKNGDGSVASITIVKSQLSSHLGHGDHLGGCTEADQPVKKVDPVPPPVVPAKPVPPVVPQKENMVTICHTNDDGTKETLTVPQSQVQQHLNHGDHFGVCTPDEMN